MRFRWLRPLPSLLLSEVYFLEDFELDLSLLQMELGDLVLFPQPNHTPGSLGNAKVWLPLMWGGDLPS